MLPFLFRRTKQCAVGGAQNLPFNSMGSEEARKYVWDYYGWEEETAEKEEYTVETRKEMVGE